MPELLPFMLSFERAHDLHGAVITGGGITVHVTDIVGVCEHNFNNERQRYKAALLMHGGDVVLLYDWLDDVVKHVGRAKTLWAESHQKKE